MKTDWPAIVAAHGPLVWRTAMRLLLNEADVSDCFQETFVSAMQFARKQDVSNWPGLLQRIATTRALDQLRKRVRDEMFWDRPLQETLPAAGGNPAMEAEAIELSDRLRVALTQLPPAQSQVFCLRQFSGLDYTDIAAEMGITANAAGALLHRARQRLAELLGVAAAEIKRN